MHSPIERAAWALACVLLLAVTAPSAATIIGSKHDLSIGTANPEPCVYCHTPHDANISAGPLWNRQFTDLTLFQPYTSSSMDTTCAATPSPVSLACLSCHDDAAFDAPNNNIQYQGAVQRLPSDQHKQVNPSNIEPSQGNCNGCHRFVFVNPPGVFSTQLPYGWQTGPDLRDDHPISMVYPTAAQDPDFYTPPDLQKGWSDVKLFNGRVECPSCHNPHDPTNQPFLRKANNTSQLCFTCHNK